MDQFGFFAMLDRMAYIDRWGLMRNSRTENIKEHSFDVAIIAHALCVIHNKLAEGDEAAIKPDPFRVQAYALYHDCTEIITGDLPTPIKYKNETIKEAYQKVEHEAAVRLSELLPSDMQDGYLELLDPAYEGEEGILCKRLVKAADRLSAYIKCVREENSGNHEFVSAKESIRESIDKLDMKEVDYFVEHFIPSYGYTLDQLTK